MHLRCPHCQNPIEVADLSAGGEVVCAGCGSSFNFEAQSTTTWEKPANQRLGKFEILATVGHGAFGTVFKARDTELDRFVAIKIPRAGNIGSGPEDVDRFLREARAVAQLRFPSIISIHEVGTDNGIPYLVSDFVDGITLADHLTGRRLSFQESARLVALVADALQYAHSLGVVHRDVKPSNIMIRPDGTPCVMDFGLAKRDAGEITMTIDGQILGTPAYMSPEQARGESRKVDGRSDVYSLGVILYQLLTGELPFRGNKSMLLHQVLFEEPRSPRTLNDKIPRDLETIALKAMAKEPSRRYASAREMAEDLRSWLAGEPIRARPVGALERLWRWSRRKPASAAMLALTLFTGVAMAVLSFVASANTLGLVTQHYRARHAEEVRVQLDTLLTMLTEAEAAQRGYLITADKQYLKRYETAVYKMDETQRTIEILSRDNPAQIERLKVLSPKIAIAIEHFNKDIKVRKESAALGAEKSFALLKTGARMPIIDEVRQAVSEMAAEESRFAGVRDQKVVESTQRTWYVLTGGALIAGVLMLIGCVLVLRSLTMSV